MAKENSYEFESKNKKNNDSTDIIDKLTELVNYLNIDEGCQMLLKPSTTDLQNEIQFNQRADQVLKHHHRHDKIMIEDNILNELQRSINIINNDLDKKLNKKELDSKNIIKIYDHLMVLKMLNLKHLKNIKSLKDFIKLNMNNLEDVTKIENELKVVLDKITKEKLSKKSEIKVPHTIKDRRPSILYISNKSRRKNHDANFRVQPRINVEHTSRQSESLTNENIVFDSQINEVIRIGFESDHVDIEENLNNQPNIDKNTRHRFNEEAMSNDLMMSSMEEVIESPNFNSSVNLCKDNEDNNSGDIYLQLQPLNNWMES